MSKISFNPPPVSSVGKTLYVDSVNGNNATAARATSKPFLTLTAAQSAAVSGDLIEVLPGTYVETNLGKNGVNWNLQSGVTIGTTAATTPGTLRYIFGDKLAGVSTAMIYTVSGEGVFINSDAAPSTASTYGILISNVNSDITVSGKKLTVVSIPDEASGFYDIGTGVYQTNGKSTIRIQTIIVAGVAIYLENGTQRIYAEEISVSGNGADITSCEGGMQWIDVKLLKVTGGFSIRDGWHVGSGVGYLRADRIEGPIGQLIHVIGGVGYADVLSVHSTGGTEAAFIGGEAYLKIGSITSTTGSAMFLAAGCNAVLDIGLAQSNQFPVVNVHTSFSGSVNLSGRYKATGTNQSVIKYNNAPTGRVILNSAVLVGTGTGNSITTISGTPTILVYGGVVANLAKHANVTIQVGTLTVDTNVQ